MTTPRQKMDVINWNCTLYRHNNLHQTHPRNFRYVTRIRLMLPRRSLPGLPTRNHEYCSYNVKMSRSKTELFYPSSEKILRLRPLLSRIMTTMTPDCRCLFPDMTWRPPDHSGGQDEEAIGGELPACRTILKSKKYNCDNRKTPRCGWIRIPLSPDT